MAVGNRGLIALTIVVAMLSLARPAALARPLSGPEPVAGSMDRAAADPAARRGCRTDEAPRHEDTARLSGVLTPFFEEDDSEQFGCGHHLAVLISAAFAPTRRLPIAHRAELLRLVNAQGWRALPGGRGPPAA
jgi:hypothetical protein